MRQEIEDVQGAGAPGELASSRDKLASRLRGMRTQLGRIQRIVDSGELKEAANALPSLLSIGEVERAIEEIRQASGTTG